MHCRSWPAALFGFALQLSWAPRAHAFERAPRAGLIAFEPNQPSHFALRTTFGLLETRNGGSSFDFTCTGVLDLVTHEDPSLVVTQGGSLLLGTIGGALFSDDGCSWQLSAGLSSIAVDGLAIAHDNPGYVLAFTASTLPGGVAESQLYESSDSGRSFSPLGDPLPDELFALSIAVAPGDSERVYMTARRELADGYASVLLRSDDGGSSFAELPFDDARERVLAQVAAAHPTDSDRVFLWSDDAATSTAWVSFDGGERFERLLDGIGRFSGLVLSPEGEAFAVGGPNDGVWVGDSLGGSLERRSAFSASCLGWSADGLYACGAFGGPDAIVRSTDQGHSFMPLFSFDELCPSTSCADDAQVTLGCVLENRSVTELLGTRCAPAGRESSDAGKKENPASPDATRPASESQAPERSSGCSQSKDHLGNGTALLLGVWLLLSTTRRAPQSPVDFPERLQKSGRLARL